MTTFNLKKNKSRMLTEIKTLDEFHKENINNFSKLKMSLPSKKNQLQLLINQLNLVEQEDFSTYTIDDIRNRAILKDNIAKLKEEIYNIENNFDETIYYSKTLNIINDYYEKETNFESLYEQDIPKLPIQPTPTEEMDILDKLNLMNKGNKKTKRIPKKRKSAVCVNRPSILSYLNQEEKPLEQKKNKSIILEQYKMLVDNEYIPDRSKVSITEPLKCIECGAEKIIDQSEANVVCKECGAFELINIEAEKPSYKEISSDKPGYPYKRINHFNEWLSQFQAKESSEIPAEIYNIIIAELRKNRITDFKKIKLKQMKIILKKLSLATYYEHVVHIISKLSGVPPPVIDRDTEEKLRKMFRQIQVPFEKHRPKERINFLSYSFVLHKLCQLLELDDFTKCFPLLKSREKLRQQDVIWKGICQDLKWEFIPSI